MRTIGGRPFRLVLRPGTREVVFMNCVFHAVAHDFVNEQMPWSVFAIVLIEGEFGHEVASRVGEAELSGDRMAVEIEEEQAQIAKPFPVLGDLVIELPRLFTAPDGCALFAFPSATFEIVKTLEHLRVS